MKTFRTKFFGLILLIAMIGLSSCIKDEFEQPPIIVPHFTMGANDTLINIIDLKASYPGTVDSIGEDWVIKGYVVAHDESGNFYKKIEIQDSTAGIELNLDRTNLYVDLRVGQLIYIKLKGLYLGDYNGLIQVGYIYNGSIGRIPDVMIDNHIYKDGFPVTPPAPIVVTIPTLNANNISMLVKLENVSFAEAGQSFATSTATTNRTIKDEAGNSLILRTSNYASFASALMPTGKGNLVGILSKFGSDWQFYIRDLTDIQNWQIDNSTYLLKEDFATGLGVMSAISIGGDQVWAQSTFGGINFAKITGFVSGTGYANEDWLISPSMNFNQYTEEKLSFQSAMKYGTPGDGTLKVMYSTNYTGSGDPNAATWTDINATLSAGNFVFTQSGEIDLSAVSGSNVYLAFKYSCGTTNVPTWEVASIAIKGKKN